MAEEQTPAVKTETKTAAKAAEMIKIPQLRPGQTIRVHQKIKEGEKIRTQVFEGLVIAMAGKTPNTKTITVRKVTEGIGVEKIFPLASPLIEQIEVRKVARVRRAKLYYLRKYKKALEEKIVA